MPKDNSGSAFPHRDIENNVESGMSLRDYFAAKAMQSMGRIPIEHESEIAESAYRIADAMLKERSLK